MRDRWWRRIPKWVVIAVAVAAALAVVTLGVVALRSGGSSSGSGPATTGAPVPTSPGAPAPTASPTPSAPPTTAPTKGTTTSAPRPLPAFGFQPLWPFSGVGDAAAWQQSYREGGHQPWHLDAGQTALGFTQSYLGYRNVDRVVSTKVVGDQAWVGVGFLLPNQRVSTAAVLHLAKISTGTDAPWEVVGTQDSTLSLTQPAYGASVTSPLTVGGRVTGVDENLQVQVRQLTRGLIGKAGGVPAGGQNAPWTTSVTFAVPKGSVLTVAVSTGGHVAAVERFAITGVRVARTGAAADGDVDGDGKADRISIPAAGRLRIDYASGRVETVAFEAGDQPARVLGSVDADHDGRAEVFVRSGSGASTEFATVFRSVADKLRVVTLDGEQTRLGYGGSVTHRDAWACRPPTEPIVTFTGTSADGERYTGPLRHYRFDGARLALIATESVTVTPADPPPTGCGSIRLG